MSVKIAVSDRSAGATFEKLLDADSHPVRDIPRSDFPMAPGPTRVPAERYFSKVIQGLDVEKTWKRVWQMARYEGDIPNVTGLRELLILVCVALALMGCMQRRSAGSVDVTHAEFRTPTESYDLEFGSSSSCSPSVPPLYGGTDDLGVTFSAVEDCRSLWIGYRLQRHHQDGRPYGLGIGHPGVEFLLDESFYRFDRHDPQPLEISITMSSMGDDGGKRIPTAMFSMKLPHPLKGIKLQPRGDGLTSAEVSVLRAAEGKDHHFFIAFLIDEERYEIDVSFQVEYDPQWDVGVPGVP